MTNSSFSTDLLRHAQLLSTTYLGLVNGLFEAINKKLIRPEALADSAGCDTGYVARWVDAAITQHLVVLDKDGHLMLSDLTEGLQISRENPNAARILQAAYSVLISDVMVPNFRNGTRPGYSIVDGFSNLVPHYSAISESLSGPIFDTNILPMISFLTQTKKEKPFVLDFGCGDGWLMRRIAQTYPTWKFLGVTPSMPSGPLEQENVEIITNNDFRQDQRSFDLIILHKVLHHLGRDLPRVLTQLTERLAQKGGILIWEFAWPPAADKPSKLDDRTFLNLIEHAQNSQFLPLEKLLSLLDFHGMTVNSSPICEGREIALLAFKSPTKGGDAAGQRA